MNTSIHTFTRCRKRESEERIRLREWEFDIPRLQQYVQLHKPEQPSITWFNTRIDFSMRLKSIFNITPVTAKSGVCTCVAFVFKGFPFVSVFAGKGFSEVADWLRVQESLKWALAGFAESWACRLWQTQLSTRTQRKENKTKVKEQKDVKMAFLLIMVATGWVWSRAEERVSRWHSQESAFFRRERERSKRSEEFKSAKKRVS